MEKEFLEAGISLWNMLGWEGKSHLFKYIYAQWYLESSRGRSALAKKHKNYGGMKYRKELSPLCRKVPYVDWQGEKDYYCSFKDPQEYAHAYWAFIHRSPYPEIDYHMDMGHNFILYLADCGYVATESPESYLNKICKIIESEDFKSHVEAVMPPMWL